MLTRKLTTRILLAAMDAAVVVAVHLDEAQVLVKELRIQSKLRLAFLFSLLGAAANLTIRLRARDRLIWLSRFFRCIVHLAFEEGHDAAHQRVLILLLHVQTVAFVDRFQVLLILNAPLL